MLIRNSILFLLFTLVIHGCGSTSTITSDEVADSDFYQKYTVDFDAENSEATFSAELRESSSSGASIELVEPASIVVNEFELSQTGSQFPVTYQKIFDPSEISNRFSVLLQIRGDLSYENEILIQDSYPSDIPTSIDRNEGAEISWTGDAILSDESISVKITDEKSYSINISSDVLGATSIVIPASALIPLDNGIIEIQIIRSREIDLGSSSAGGKFLLTYRSQVSAANLSGTISVSLN